MTHEVLPLCPVEPGHRERVELLFVEKMEMEDGPKDIGGLELENTHENMKANAVIWQNTCIFHICVPFADWNVKKLSTE